MRSLILSALLALAAANPVVEGVVKRVAACSTVTCKNAAASAYCSSYLSIPVKTSTVTTTQAPRTVTTKVTSTTATVSTTLTITSCAPPTPAAKPKRDFAMHANVARALAKPPCLSAYSAAGQISSACKCLSISTSTTTVTKTKTANRIVVTSTVGATYTASYATIDDSALSAFVIQANDGTDNAVIGNYAVNSGADFVFNGGKSDGTVFTFPNCNGLNGNQGTVQVISSGDVLAEDFSTDNPDYHVQAVDTATLNDPDGTYFEVNCGAQALNDGTCSLTCNVNGKTSFRNGDNACGSSGADWCIGNADGVPNNPNAFDTYLVTS